MDCDRISEFPDSLLSQILSYLPTKDSVKTSVLSKRWEFLWLKVSGLDLNANDFLPYGEALSSFMDRFLELNRESRLHKLKIKYNRYTNTMNEDCKRSLVEEWITQMFHRGGVQHLDIEKETCRDLDILPKSVYVSKTLVSLKLVRVGIEDTNLDLVVSLPCLKILHLEDTYTVLERSGFFIMDYITDANLSIMEKLISGSPVLENITMEYSMSPWPDQVSSFWTSVPQCLSSTLEYVTIYKQIVKKETGIKLVNFFLENSAVLKKLTLSCTHSHDTTTNQDAESYKKLLTSTKLSPRCQVLVC